MKDKQYVIVRNDDDSIKGKAYLAGKVVGVQQASTGEAALQTTQAVRRLKKQILCGFCKCILWISWYWSC